MYAKQKGVGAPREREMKYILVGIKRSLNAQNTLSRHGNFTFMSFNSATYS